MKLAIVHATNPASFPPLTHAASLLSAQHEVTVLGGRSRASNQLRSSVEHLTRRYDREAGPLNVKYLIWAGATLRREKPDLLWLSDFQTAPLWRAASARQRLVYQEHDIPQASSMGNRVLCRERRLLLQRADIVFAPNEARLDALRQAAPSEASFISLPNYPLAGEVARARATRGGPLRVCYAGSVNSQRLPYALLETIGELSDSIEFSVYGYVTEDGFTERANHCLGTTQWFKGPLDRARLLGHLLNHDLGLVGVPVREVMAGASNKIYDYWSQGLAAMVPARSDLAQLTQEVQGALVVDFGDTAQIRQTLLDLASRPDRARVLGEAGRQAVAQKFHYEAAAVPVFGRVGLL